jgi:polyketide synthase PksM
MHDLLCSLLAAQLLSMGVTSVSPASLADSRKRAGIKDSYCRWLEETANFLKRQGSFDSFARPTYPEHAAGDIDTLWNEWNREKQRWSQQAWMKTQVVLVESALKVLPEILRGQVLATDVLFPNSSMERVEGIYKHNPVADFYNHVLADTVSLYIEQRLSLDPSARFRILEIGAGTGGTSAVVMDRLKPYQQQIAEYCYTDLSRAFLMHAEKEYGPAYPYLAYRLFDVSFPVGEQGIELGAYDIVIAANVLHATRNVRETLRNAKAVLKRNGLLLLNEICSNDLFTHLTFGLLDGWWLYEDPDLRIPGCPGLYPETWREVLQDEGFDAVVFPALEEKDLGHQIIASESNGVVRQKKVAVPTPPAKPQVQVDVEKTNLKKVEAPRPDSSISGTPLREKCIGYLKKLVAETIRSESGKIDSATPLKEYGIDSILIVQLTNKLRKAFKSVTSTLFFELQTIDNIAERLVDTEQDALRELLGVASPDVSDHVVHNDAPVRANDDNSRTVPLVGKPEAAVTVTAAGKLKDIAVIGMSGRYPQAKNLEEFWENLKAGRNCVTEIPQDRWDWREYFDVERGKFGSIYTKWGGFLNEVDKFDPLFFQISPAEAERMDPQERLFLEEAYASIEDAGYTPAGLSRNGKVGVFVGVMNATYPTAASYWSIANRVSYTMNFNGPSIAVDTACSSSLTAIHLALESLYSGTSDCAIAGGVNLILDPSHFLRLSSMSMLSSGNQCKAFGSDADGFIDAEGVGALVLKPLEKAIADGDHIYGVIKGSMLNAGGKTNGYTVPNPSLQSQLIADSLDRAGIDPRTLSYVEAHGTGTALGDPIEIAGLIKAFSRHGVDKQYCAIGSVKTNIGHCESAAGLAGVTKVLLQMSHRQLVPSLHAEVSNPEIDFTQTPFFIQDKLTEWKAPEFVENGRVERHPRRASVSSFGAGGANAHVLIEEYVASQDDSRRRDHARDLPAVIVLSAKSEARLKERVQRLLSALRNKSFIDEQLHDIAYTLQVGREEMEERLAVTAMSLQELELKLSAFLDGKADIEGLYTGTLKVHKDSLRIFADDEDIAQTIDIWFRKGKYGKLSEAWTKGLVINWNRLYGGRQLRRLSLPSYPFAKERYWISEDKARYGRADGKRGERPMHDTASRLHPLLHRNVSDFSGQKYESVLTGSEFVLAEHVIGGTHILPGVAYLEMARAGFCLATGLEDSPRATISIRDVIWSCPVAVDESPAKLRLTLTPRAEGRVGYRICSASRDGAGDVLHNEGEVALDSPAVPEFLNLGAMRMACEAVPSNRLYDRLKQRGIEYGEKFQAVKELYVGDGELFAKLVLPATLDETLSNYVLHPSLMDAALHASAAFDVIAGDKNGTAVPLQSKLLFALKEITIAGRCGKTMWVHVRRPEARDAAGGIERLDIDLCDETGRICIWLRGATSKVVEHRGVGLKIAEASQPFPSVDKAVKLVPGWEPVELPAQANVPDDAGDMMAVFGASKAHKIDMLGRFPRARFIDDIEDASITDISQQLRDIGPLRHLVWIARHAAVVTATDEAIIDGQRTDALSLFKIVKTLASLGYCDSALRLTVVTTASQAVLGTEEITPTHASLHGFAGALAKEFPNWSIHLVDVGGNELLPLADIIRLVPADRDGNAWALRQNVWYRQTYALAGNDKRDHGLYRNGGVYVVIGGAGSLGEIWSRHMMERFQARIVWIGRRAKDQEIQARIDALARIGEAPLYISADATDRAALQGAYEEIKRRYGKINGIVHSAAGMLGKQIADMDEARFREGFAAKVDVSVRLAQVFRNEELDFVLFFSSIISFARNAKQSNYAAGSTFADAYAYRLGREWRCPVKVMNWGYWGSVGIVASSDSFQQWMASHGMGSIEAAEALDNLDQLLASPHKQMIFMKVTSPAGLQGMTPHETVEAVREELPSTLHGIDTHASAGRAGRLQVDRLEKYFRDDEFDGLMLRIMKAQLQTLGDDALVFGDVARSVGHRRPVDAKYARWLEESRNLLADMRKSSAPSSLDVDGLWREWDRLSTVWRDNPGLQAKAVLAEKTLRALPEILTGKTRATDILFPKSSLDLVQGIYKENPVSDYYNQIVAETIVAHVKERIRQQPGARVRILEIGAGTGGTSAMIFSKLRGLEENIQEYCYTDLSKAFLIHAEQTYRGIAPYLRCQVLDIEKPVAQQGIEPGSYDLVIAANVLHATKDILQTVKNAKIALKKNALMVLNEMSCNSVFAHLTFGLLDGWWLYQDAALRIPGCPGLYPERWRQILELAGFRHVLFPAAEGHGLGQQVIVAESDGIVRYRLDSPIGMVTAKMPAPAANVAPSSEPHESWRGKPNGSFSENHVRDIVREKLAAALRMSPEAIDVDEPFSHYGLDSILGVNVVKTINQVLGIDLDTTSLFDYSSINRLAAHIHAAYGHRLKTYVAAEKAHSPYPAMPAPVSAPAPIVAPAAAACAVAPTVSQVRPKVTSIDIPASSDPASHAEAVVTDQAEEPIAIVGVSARYAQSGNMEALWQNLANGADLVGKASRWTPAEHLVYGEGEMCQYGSFLDEIDKFDPLFFSISGLEAKYMDPQQRIFLEESWKALEDAGYAGKAIEGKRCGVYVGYNGGDYQRLVEKDAPAQAMWGNIGSIIPARISYYLNLQGPAIALDSACSSSLVSIHLACQALWIGEIDMALAGGVYVQSTPWFLAAGNRAGMLSKTGRCFTFDERADGFVPGEGCGVVVLKRLKDAIADGDHIYGVIRGSGVNQDGATNGITAPSALSQERLECEVYDRFGIDPAQIQLVEAHGTGTHLGDPIEFRALTNAFRKYTDQQQYCAIGSIKTNIGHTTAAAGVAGVIKILAALKYQQLPPSIHFRNGNPNIRFEQSPFYVNTELKEWKVVPGVKRRAAVSAFGLSGTNAHMVIEEAPAIKRHHQDRPGYLIALSARTDDQLRKQVEQIVAYCRNTPAVDCGNLSFTLLMGRKHLSHRWACIVRDRDELIELASGWLKGTTSQRVCVSALEEKEIALPDSLKRHANQCLADCRVEQDAGAYFDKLAAVMDLYIQGYGVDFACMFSGDGYTRLSLPTYPFAKGRYWVSMGRPAFEDQVVPTASVDIECPAELGDARDLPGSIDVDNGETQPLLDGTVVLTSVWDTVEIEASKDHAAETGVFVMIGGGASVQEQVRAQVPGCRTLDIAPDDTIETIIRKMSECGQIGHLFWCAPDTPIASAADDKLIHAQDGGLFSYFRLIKAAIQLGYESRSLSLTTVTTRAVSIGNEEVNPVHAGLHGFMGSLAKEYPAWKVRVADMEAADGWPLDQILSLPPCPKGNALAYRTGEWHREKLVPCKLPLPHEGLYKRGGIYVVIGGAGGIGAAWSEHMLRRYGAQLVWIGRRQKDEAIQAQLDRLAAFGPTPHYIAADAARRNELEDAYREIRQRFGRIDGIVHSAIALTDKSIANMTEGRFRTGLSAKIDVCARLAQVFGREPLDFVLFFSSIITFTKAAGQSNYAAGCTFKDSFAKRLAQEWPCKVKVMNWGYWGSVGVVASDEYRKRMEKIGVASIELPEAMEGLDLLLGGPLERVAMLKTARPISMDGVDTTESIEFCEKDRSASAKTPAERHEFAASP